MIQPRRQPSAITRSTRQPFRYANSGLARAMRPSFTMTVVLKPGPMMRT
jgi:hypothetical protein